MKGKDYICHSGGAFGSDREWELENLNLIT